MIVAGLLLLAMAVNVLFDDDLSFTEQGLVFVLAIVIASYETRLGPRGAALRRDADQARAGEARARSLQALAMELASAVTHDDVERAGRHCIAQAFGAGCQLLPHGEGAAPAVIGVPPDPGAQKLAQSVRALLAQAASRVEAAASEQARQEHVRWQRAQETFLAGISHDFRTPLAAMVTAASSLQEQRDKLGIPEQERLARIILDEAAHLATLTENMLQLSRLQHAGEIHRDWQSMEEIVGVVLARMRRRDGGDRIRSHVPPQLPLIQADPALLAQLLDNLLDNALKYSDEPVALVASASGDRMEVAVHDRGRGIPPGDEEAVFEPYRRSDRSGQRGAGLGLAVCRAIARAHGGELLFRRRADGGSSFVLGLPVQPVHLVAEAVQRTGLEVTP